METTTKPYRFFVGNRQFFTTKRRYSKQQILRMQNGKNHKLRKTIFNDGKANWILNLYAELEIEYYPMASELERLIRQGDSRRRRSYLANKRS